MWWRVQVQRLGVGGRLVPFFKCVCVYFVARGAGDGAPSPGAAAAKCAPVLALLLVVLLHHAALPYHKYTAHSHSFNNLHFILPKQPKI